LAGENRGVLVLLPKNKRINNIFQSFIASKTRIKLSKTAYNQAIRLKAFFATLLSNQT
jgi:hypothetical protein